MFLTAVIVAALLCLFIEAIQVFGILAAITMIFMYPTIPVAIGGIGVIVVCALIR